MRLRVSFTGLWRDPDFIKLWIGQTISRFGSYMGALQFTAVVLLGASAFQMGLLSAIGVAPGLLIGFFAGVWVDRMRRRPLLIIADVGRAGLLASIPIAFVFDVLLIEQLYAVAFLNGIMRTFFDVAFPTYVPTLVGRENLIDANSKLSASESVVEATAFSIGGWIVQLVHSIAAVIVDALSFLVSAIFLMGIRKPEVDPPPPAQRQQMLPEILEGIMEMWRTPVLRAVMGSAIAEGLLYGIVGAIILVFGVRELGFGAGVLGTIFAVGGVSSIFSATFATRITRRFGVGRTVIVGFLIFALATLFLPLARGPLVIAGIFLVAGQIFGDGAATIYGINEISLRQSVTSDRLLGRVNASIRFVGVSAFFVGSLSGGILAEVIGLRLTFVLGAAFGILGAIWLTLSPIRSLKELSRWKVE